MDRFLTPGRAIAAVALIAFLAAALTALVGGIPQPKIADEDSYLLAAETYAHGRLTNQPDPAWPWLETYHVLQQPTYMSKFPPAQGGVLALGWLVGLPVAGIWLSVALAAAAVTWMLLGWMPTRWAFLGGVLFALHPMMLEWSHAYWGGAVAALGGALVLGGARRLVDGGRVRDSALLGLGVVILANSRPWEGAVFVAALFGVSAAMRLLRWKALAPAAIVVLCGAAFMLYDNRQVTGHALLLPWQEYARQYDATPPLLWQRTHPVKFRHEMMRRLSAGEYFRFYQDQRDPSRILQWCDWKMRLFTNSAFNFVPDTMLRGSPWLVAAVSFLVETLLLAPLFLLITLLKRDRLLRAVAIVGLITLVVALLPAVLPQAHYAAPLAPLLLLLWLSAVRDVRFRGTLAVIAVIWILGGAVVLDRMSHRAYHWFDTPPERQAITRKLLAMPGKHLILVRYGSAHHQVPEWVTNGADIEGSRIVWAHDLGDNRALLQRFSGRRVWRVVVAPGARLTAE